MHTKTENDPCNLTHNVQINKGSNIKLCARHTHTQTHKRICTHAHTFYRWIGVKDSVAWLKYLEKRNVLSLLLKKERIAVLFSSLFCLFLLAVYWHNSGPPMCVYMWYVCLCQCVCVCACAHMDMCVWCVCECGVCVRECSVCLCVCVRMFVCGVCVCVCMRMCVWCVCVCECLCVWGVGVCTSWLLLKGHHLPCSFFLSSLPRGNRPADCLWCRQGRKRLLWECQQPSTGRRTCEWSPPSDQTAGSALSWTAGYAVPECEMQHETNNLRPSGQHQLTSKRHSVCCVITGMQQKMTWGVLIRIKWLYRNIHCILPLPVNSKKQPKAYFLIGINRL